MEEEEDKISSTNGITVYSDGIEHNVIEMLTCIVRRKQKTSGLSVKWHSATALA
jgi:hypothetical protein